MHFRHDINGLRAIAVLAVMLYHFGISSFTGGFAGVDVFFVISGYLMTAIVVGGLRQSQFSLLSFYMARARRILPALAVLCLALLIAGWAWLPPTDYKMLGRHAASALVFISNFIFKNEDGYFDVFSQDKWLLHTWSLSVEWQFYLLYPLLLMGLWRTGHHHGQGAEKRLLRWLLALTTGGFLFCTLYTPVDPAFAFYLLPTRLWEMSAGGLVFLLAARGWSVPQPLMFYAGFLSIGLATVLFDANTVWPGAAALLPVAGAALVIMGAQTHHRALNNPAMQAIGTWSYSIYLWHWPVVVALHQFGYDKNPLWDAAGLALSVLLGALSYHTVEKPLRQRSETSRLTAIPLLTMVFLAIAGSALWIDKQDGLAQRAHPAVHAIESEVAASRALRPKPCKSDPLIYDMAPCATPTTTPDFIVWGDSHASVLHKSIEMAAGTLEGYSYQATCPPVPEAYLTSKKFSYMCPDYTRAVFDRIDDMPRHVPVIVVFRMSIYMNGYNERPDKQVGLRFNNMTAAEEDEPAEAVFAERLNDSLCQLTEGGRPVYVMQPVPEIGLDVPHEMTRDIMFKGKPDNIALPLSQYTARHEPIMTVLRDIQKDCGIKLLDPAAYLCRDGACVANENGLPLYTDDNHLARHGSDKLVAMFRSVFTPN